MNTFHHDRTRLGDTALDDGLQRRGQLLHLPLKAAHHTFAFGFGLLTRQQFGAPRRKTRGVQLGAQFGADQ